MMLLMLWNYVAPWCDNCWNNLLTIWQHKVVIRIYWFDSDGENIILCLSSKMWWERSFSYGRTSPMSQGESFQHFFLTASVQSPGQKMSRSVLLLTKQCTHHDLSVCSRPATAALLWDVSRLFTLEQSSVALAIRPGFKKYFLDWACLA